MQVLAGESAFFRVIDDENSYTTLADRYKEARDIHGLELGAEPTISSKRCRDVEI